MSKSLEQQVLLAAFNDELEKLAHQREVVELEKWASTHVSDWGELNELEKQAFIGKLLARGAAALKSGAGAAVDKLKGAFGSTQALGGAVTKATRPSPLPAVTQAAKHTGVNTPVASRGQTAIRTAGTGGFTATRGGGARTGQYTAGIAPNFQKMSHARMLVRMRKG